MLTERLHGRTGAALIAGACAAAIVALAAFAPVDRLAVKDPALRVASETAACLGLLIAGWIAMRRAGRTGVLGDRALAVGIGIVSLNSILVLALDLAVEIQPSTLVTWVLMPGWLAAGALLVAAGLPDRAWIVDPPRRLAFAAVTVSVTLALAIAGAGMGALGSAGHVSLVSELFAAALLLAASVALGRRARQFGDPALPWYAVAVLALGVSRMSGVLSDVPEVGWFTLADVGFLSAVGLLLIGGRAELGEAGDRTLEDALDVERRRLAREIHDGLAQELAFIVSQSRRLARRAPNAGALELLAQAGETALMDARRAIFSLKRPQSRALSTVIAERAFLIAERARLAVDVEVVDEAAVTPEVEHAVMRIIDEAVSNVARHARATSVSIRVSSEEDRVVVRISDDGQGLDQRPQHRRRGFGLVSMTERAESLGGRLQLESEPGEGTVIEVTI